MSKVSAKEIVSEVERVMEEGKRARLDAKSVASNPYRSDRMCKIAWEFGWRIKDHALKQPYVSAA